jgi:UPF0716 family protein affecting phage T7 exclusion
MLSSFQLINIVVSVIGGIIIFNQVIAIPILFLIMFAFTVAGTFLFGKDQVVLTGAGQQDAQHGEPTEVEPSATPE